MITSLTNRLSELIEQNIDPQGTSQERKTYGDFNWTNPMPKTLSDKDLPKIFDDISDRLQSEFTGNEKVRSFFKNDIRALKLYLQHLPYRQILSSDKSSSIPTDEFNQFFKENYIDNQAFKLDERVLSNYQDYLLNEGFITWNQYVNLAQNSPGNKTNANQLADYSFDYFFNQLKKEERIGYLSSQSVESEIDIRDKFILPELNTLQQELGPKKGMTDTPQGENIQTQEQSYASSKDNVERDDGQSDSIKVSQIRIPNILAEEDNTKQIQDNYSTNTSFKSQPISQVSKRTVENIAIKKAKENDTYGTPPEQQRVNIDLKKNIPAKRPREESLQKEEGRQKQRNYAKIIGYSTAGTLSGVSAAIASSYILFS